MKDLFIGFRRKLRVAAAIMLFPLCMLGQQKQGQTELRKTVTLLQGIKALNKEKGIYFLFSDSSIGNRAVNAEYDHSRSPEDILKQMLKGSGLTYKKLKEKTFVILDEKKQGKNIEKVEGLVFDADGVSYASGEASSRNNGSSQRLIKGEVLNSKDNSPMEGVTITIKGTNEGTVSASNGSFSIMAANNTELNFFRVGFNAKLVKVGKSGFLQIGLEEKYNNLGEVVVVAYGTQKKSTFTGAASNVPMDMVEKAPRSSVQESLQGNVPGVISTNGSGQPGSVPSVRIRGIGSINASSAPLYVVDGIPVVSGDITGYNTNTLAAINSSDIESFVVLKDASATALYGSRGANGVILITTKKGKAGKTRFNFTVQQGVNVQGIREKDKTLNTSEAIQYLREAWVNSGKTAASFDQELITRDVDSSTNTDWFKEVMHNGRFLNADLNISGGTDKSTFYLSGGYYKSQAVQRGVGYDKATLRLNIKNKATNKLTINGGIGLAYQKSTNSLGGSYFANPIRAMYRLQPWLKVYNDDGSYNTSYNSGYNPVAIINNNFRKGETYYVSANAGATYNFTPDISIESKAAVDFNHGFTQSYSDPRYGNANVSAGGVAENYNQDIMNWISTNILRYKKEIKNHNFEAFAGYEVNKRTDKDQSNTVNQLVPGLQTGANGSLPVAASATITANSVLSSFLNLNYDYNDRYYVTGSFRRDGSSRFGRDNKFGNFWSVGGGWNLYKEKFFKIKTISELRLRASYGATGNQTGIDNFGALGLYSTSNDYNAVPGYVFSQFENNTLTWEKNYPLNVGIDFAILEGRFRGTMEYYNRNTKSLLLDVLVPATNGISSYLDNYGSMSNQGIEVGITTTNVKPKKATGFKWTSDIVFSTNKNRITGINVPIRTDFLNREVGLDFYQWYLAGFAGVDSLTGRALWYKDKNEEETTTSFASATRYNQGSALPTFTGSLKNTFSYKNFTLLFQFYVNWGNKVRDIHGVYTSADASAGFSATGNVSRYNYEHRWQNPGDITDVPKPVYLGQQTGLSNMMSTRFLYDGSYIRLRDLSISYNLPRALVKRFKLTSSKLYLRSNNLFTWVKDKRMIFDPEVPVGGTIDQRPPVFKTVLLGLDINF
jgi:TonB-linked SusC/RagA family outer membrane protein